MKLYCVPNTCSIASHIVLLEGKFDFVLDRVDVRNGKKTESGRDYVALNPKGYVPALELNIGKLITEGAVILQYLADQRPELKLAPPPASLERYALQEWLLFIATELHKGMSPFYQPTAGEELRAVLRGRLEARFKLLEAQVAKGGAWLLGEQFTIADAYAFYVLRAYQKVIKATLTPVLAAYYARLVERPSVKAALEADKLEP